MFWTKINRIETSHLRWYSIALHEFEIGKITEDMKFPLFSNAFFLCNGWKPTYWRKTGEVGPTPMLTWHVTTVVTWTSERDDVTWTPPWCDLSWEFYNLRFEPRYVDTCQNCRELYGTIYLSRCGWRRSGVTCKACYLLM